MRTVRFQMVAPVDLPAIGRYLQRKVHDHDLGGRYIPHHAMIYIDDEQKVRGAIALKLLNPFEGSVTIAVDPGYFPSIAMVRELCRLVFVELGLKRLTSHVARANKRARRLNEGMGFKLEGLKRRGYDGIQPACVYGMTVDECRWLKTRNDDG